MISPPSLSLLLECTKESQCETNKGMQTHFMTVHRQCQYTRLSRPEMRQYTSTYTSDDAIARLAIEKTIRPDPKERATAAQLLHHPLFWSAKTRLQLVVDASERLKIYAVDELSRHLAKSLEHDREKIFPGNWWECIRDEELQGELQRSSFKFRGKNYDYESVRDLLSDFDFSRHRRPKNVSILVCPDRKCVQTFWTRSDLEKHKQTH